jgi:serine/threonine protein kinase
LRIKIALLHQLADWLGVVKMADHFNDEAQGKASVCLEYCDGRDLEAIIQASKEHNRIHERKFWEWFIRLMDILVYLRWGPEPEDNEKVLKYWI